MSDLTDYEANDVELAFIRGMADRINRDFPHLEARLTGEHHQHYHLDDNKGHALNPPELEIYQRQPTRGWVQRLGSICVIRDEVRLTLADTPDQLDSSKINIPGIGDVLCMFGKAHTHSESYAIADPASIDNILASLAKIASGEISFMPIVKGTVWTVNAQTGEFDAQSTEGDGGDSE